MFKKNVTLNTYSIEYKELGSGEIKTENVYAESENAAMLLIDTDKCDIVSINTIIERINYA